MDIEEVRRKCAAGAIKWTVHGLERMQERDISRDDVKTCILQGEIIEDYPDDFPLPSALFFCILKESKPIHVVVAMNDESVFVITAYMPDEEKFQADWRTRRK